MDRVKANRWALVEVDKETMRTSRPNVFAGGDNVNGADLVVTAMADGRRAADAIHHSLTVELPQELARHVMAAMSRRR